MQRIATLLRVPIERHAELVREWKELGRQSDPPRGNSPPVRNAAVERLELEAKRLGYDVIPKSQPMQANQERKRRP